jgi:hypothetical protein
MHTLGKFLLWAITAILWGMLIYFGFWLAGKLTAQTDRYVKERWEEWVAEKLLHNKA